MWYGDNFIEKCGHRIVLWGYGGKTGGEFTQNHLRGHPNENLQIYDQVFGHGRRWSTGCRKFRWHWIGINGVDWYEYTLEEKGWEFNRYISHLGGEVWKVAHTQYLPTGMEYLPELWNQGLVDLQEETTSGSLFGAMVWDIFTPTPTPTPNPQTLRSDKGITVTIMFWIDFLLEVKILRLHIC